MATTITCGQCGTILPANAPEGLCPRCLVGMAFTLSGQQAGGLPVLPHPAPRATNSPRAQTSRHFGDYELLNEIARGGMGIVYQARQVSLNRVVAVKVLLFGRFSSDDAVQRFLSEATAAAGLQHPHIVTIHDVGQHEGQHYFSMEYVQGTNLAELLHDGPLPAARAARFIQAIAQGVHYAHEHKILHRDLKPSNILIDCFDQPRITDFGLAKQLKVDSGLTLPGEVLGSPNYMSPEQASPDRGQAGVTSDIYSLGAILFHLLTGRPPFLAETIEQTLMHLLHNEPVPPRLLNPGVPRDLETICLKCLAKEPERRYRTADELAAEIGRWLKGEPILARPCSSIEKLWRWCHRKPAVAALTSTVLLLLLLSAVGSTVAMLKFKGMRDEIRNNLYVTDMSVAFRDLQEGNTAQAVQRLKQHLPLPGEEDLRDFAWRYLWRRSRGTYSQWLPIHTQVVGTIQFSPNGKLVAAYAWNDTVRVWDLATRQNLFTAQNVSGFGGFSLDGSNLAVSRRDGTLQWLNSENGATNDALPNSGELVAFAPRGQIALTVSGQDVLQVINLTNSQVKLPVRGTVRRKLDYGWGDPVCVSADGTKLVVIEPNKNLHRPDVKIRLWDLQTAEELEPLEVQRQVRAVEFSPNGKILAVGDGDGNLTIWNLLSREHKVFRASALPILALAFSPDGELLASGSSEENSIRIWEVATGLPRPNTFPGQVGHVWSLAFSSDGSQLASGTRGGPIRIWDIEQTDFGEIVPERLHADEYGNFVFSPNSQFMAAGCTGERVIVWDLATLKVKTVLTNVSYVAAFSADSRSLLVSTIGGTPHWRDMQTQKARPIPIYEGNIHRVVSFDLSPNRRIAALGFPNGSIQLRDIESGRLAGPLLEGHSGAVRSVAFSPSGDQLASGGSDKAVMLWDIKTGKGLGACREHKGGVFGVAISPDGKTLASGCGAETIKFWNLGNVSTGSVVSLNYHKSVIRTLAFSPDGKTLASGSEDQTVKLWNVALKREVASFKHEDYLRLVVFSPDGDNLATVTDKGVLRVFRAISLRAADHDLENPLR